MSITKYCRDCKAQVSESEEVCPFCGGELASEKPVDKPIEPEYLSDGMSRKEYEESAVSVTEKRSRRTWTYFAMCALLFSVGTAGEGILDVICFAGLIVAFCLTLAYFLTKLSPLCVSASAVSLGVLIYSFIKFGGNANIGLIFVVVSAYLSYVAIKLDVNWIKYKKGKKVTAPIDDAELVKRWKPDTVKKTVLISIIFAVAFAALISVITVVNFNEKEKYKGYTEGFWEGNKYYNNFAGVEVVLPDGWEKMDQAELAEKNKKDFGKANAAYCFWLTDKNGNYAYLELYKQGTEKYEVEDFLGVVRDNTKDADNKATQTVKFAGKDYPALVSNVNSDGKTEKSVLLAGKYLKYTIMIKFVADSDENAQIIEDAFGFNAEYFGK